MHAFWFICVVVLLAFIFDFINGFHDAANSIATVVSTGVLKPFTAVIWAAFFNFIAFLFFHLKVAGTIGTGLVATSIIDPYTIFSALIGAISFNLFTWYFGLPSSSSHALIGGLIGAAVIEGGFKVLIMDGIIKVLLAVVISPLLGGLLSLILIWICKNLLSGLNPHTVNRWARRFQLVSSALLSLGHGGNDAQKTMGIIAVLLFSSHLIGPEFYVPFWVVVSCNLLMGLGTLAGGWRIVHTLGSKITELTPLSGGCAQGAAGITLFVANGLGIPVSTTHTVTGSIIGVGASKGRWGNNWTVIQRILIAWVFTIPAAGLVSAGVAALRYIH